MSISSITTIFLLLTYINHRDQELNEEMADFLMESALKDMGIEAEMKEMAIVKKEPTATSLLLTYRELYLFPPFLLEEIIPV